MIELHRVSKVYSVGPVKVPALRVRLVRRPPRGDSPGGVFGARGRVGWRGRAGAHPARLRRGEAAGGGRAGPIGGGPPLLLADEPTGNLDEAMAAEIVDVLKDIGAGGTTIVLATHQARLALALRRRTLTLAGGRVVKDEG